MTTHRLPGRQQRVWQYVRPWLYPKQRAAIFAVVRYVVIEATPKCGKTIGCLAWLIEQAVLGRSGDNFWWVAPVTDQTRMAFQRAAAIVPRNTCRVSLTRLTLTLPNGAVIWFKSADAPDSLYGEDVYAAVIDEAPRCKEAAWHAVRTTLTATKGPIRIIGNVKGRRNWAYLLARRAEAGEPDMHYARLTAADAIEAGIFDAEELADAERLLPPPVFRELYWADASDDQGNPFGLSAIRAATGPLSSNSPYVWGWDLAKSRDWTVGIALDVDGAVCQLERFQRPWEETFDTIRRATGPVPALIDSTGVGDPVVERLQHLSGRRFEGYLFSAASKQRLMEGLVVALHERRVQVPAGPIVAELEAFEYQYTRTGVRYSAPDGFQDDCVVALALAVQAHGKRSRRVPQGLLFDGSGSGESVTEELARLRCQLGIDPPEQAT